MESALPGQNSSVLIREHKYRLTSIDFLRGLVMIVMALDHARENLHVGAYLADPLNLETTTPVLFFTRWITHFCAPVFVFLSGTAVYLQGLRKSRAELATFLVKRGFWLIFVEVVLVTFAITFNYKFSLIILQVIWAIGVSMILLAAALRLGWKGIAIIGGVVVALHNLLDFYEAVSRGSLPAWYAFIHTPFISRLSEGISLGIFYPFLPWMGVMFLGYAFGKIYDSGSTEGRRRTIYWGLALILLFIVLRATNVYGDPLKWTKQATPGLTILSFINTQKYPPSLLYLCMTIGPALLLLGFIKSIRSGLGKAITIYGRVPFLYYLLHFYLLHLIAAILFLIRGHSLKEGIQGTKEFPFHFIVPGEGYSLSVVYIIWLAVVVFLFPVCKWFSRYKQQQKKWWLSYM